jgi:N-acetylglucosamine repressor
MILTNKVDPALLGRLNGRRILEALLREGAASRADLVRSAALSAPTVSKAVDALLEAGLLEEGEPPRRGAGRPARLLRPASDRARILGVVLDARSCEVAAAGLDGALGPGGALAFPTPATYGRLLDAVSARLRIFLKDPAVTTLGIGISMPGLIDRVEGRGLLSPNLHLTDGRTPARDLEERFGLPCTVRQESHGLCLAESLWGAARGLEDFALLDASTGLGLGVVTGGRLLEGGAGLAGELGHIPAEPGGRACGCGNRGCLETVASDSAFARAASEALGRTVDAAEALRTLDDTGLRGPLDRSLDGLAVAVAVVVNVLNPATLFLHGRLLESREETLRERVARRALRPALERCRLVPARVSKRLGALAAAADRVLDSLGPRIR